MVGPLDLFSEVLSGGVLLSHTLPGARGLPQCAVMPRKRVGQPKDLDAVLMLLCANESHFVNGAVISADDGQAL